MKNGLVDARGQRGMAGLLGAYRKATVPKIITHSFIFGMLKINTMTMMKSKNNTKKTNVGSKSRNYKCVLR